MNMNRSLRKRKISLLGQIVTQEKVLKGFVRFKGEGIKEIGSKKEFKSLPDEEVLDFEDNYILPGFIDLHNHGAGGFNTIGNQLGSLATYLVQFGVTAFLPTLAPCNLSYQDWLTEIGKRQSWDEKSALILGAHMEGPFINPGACGGMDKKYLEKPSLHIIRLLMEHNPGVLKRMTISPELAGAEEVISYLSSSGVVVSLGHSNADFKTILRAVEAGANHVTHLFNNAPYQTLHKEPGVRLPSVDEMFLTFDHLSVEFIGDGIHVDPALVSLVWKVKGPDKIALITDSTLVSGLKDGKYKKNDEREVILKEGRVRLVKDGRLAGSVLTMDRGFANLVKIFDFSLTESALCCATNPARILNLSHRMGSIEVGKEANLTVLSRNFECLLTVIRGKILFRKSGISS